MVQNLHSFVENVEQQSLQQLYECLQLNRSFVFEAAAGAGKTYSLVKGLKFLLENHGQDLMRRNQKIACITFTNVAKDEIKARTYSNSTVLAETIHAFCWSMLKNFQQDLRLELPLIGKWSERIEVRGPIGTKPIEYDLGYPRISEDKVMIGHDDVLRLMVRFLEKPKFRAILSNCYPILFIDEYQDTDKDIVQGLLKYFVENDQRPLLGFFGDHWQKIYANNPCGKIEHPDLVVIEKKANFRSDKLIVQSLNRMREEHQQQYVHQSSEGSIIVFHTNDWSGERLGKQPWKEDLPPEISHLYLQHVISQLSEGGWDFTSSKLTKTLMLTHNVLSSEQGYRDIDNVFSKNRDAYTKKEDPYIAFFVDVLEPACVAYKERRYGAMFAALAHKAPVFRSHADKGLWVNAMEDLLLVCQNGTIGQVIEYLKASEFYQLPETIERIEHKHDEWLQLPVEQRTEEDIIRFTQLDNFKSINYVQIVAVKSFIDEESTFGTKHGVKGAQFDNVLVVFGRGWNLYNFGQMLEWVTDQGAEYKQETYERNRNLYYVACSRAKKRLALLFTQKLTDSAYNTLANWYGPHSIRALPDLGNGEQ